MKKIPRIKSIYLDWNVFQDIFQNRKSPRLLANLDAAKKKGYSIPYSHIHIEDLLRCSNADYVKSDLDMLAMVTENICIGPHRDGSGFCIDKIPPKLIFDAMDSAPKNNSETKEFKFEFPSYMVDTEKLSSGNVLLPFLQKTNGLMSPELLGAFVDHLLEHGLTDHKLQRDFRNSFIEVVRLDQPAVKVIRGLPFYEHLLSTSIEIEQDFISIFESFLSIDGRSIDSISEEDKFTIAYGILDLFPEFKEKIERKNNLNNMLSDALHVYVASKCSYFICGDKKSVKKARVIYRAFQVKTKIYYVGDFINNVEL